MPRRSWVQPTRWQDVKWHIGYRFVGRVLRASAERLKMLGERAGGDRPSNLEEDHPQSYDHGYRMGREAAVRTFLRLEATR